MKLNIFKPSATLTSRRRLGLALFMLAVLPGAFLVCDPATAESVRIRQIVLSTDDIPSGGATFGDLRAPSINVHGAIAFEDGFGGAIYTTAHGRVVGRLIRAVGAGDVPPGILGSFGSVAEPSLNDDGSFAFRGFGLDSSDRGIYLFLARGKLRLVADASTVRPGTQETFSAGGPGVPVASDGGRIVFSHSTASTQGAYRADIETTASSRITLAELVVLEDGFLGLPGFESPLGYAINDLGVVAMVLQRLDFTRGIYVARPDISPRPIVAEGDPAPGGGNFTGNLGAPSINALRRVAFLGGFNDDLDVGIFIANSRGVITKVVDNKTEVPNHPGTFFNGFGSIHLDDGTIIFQGRYSLNGQDFQGIYKRSSAGIGVIFDQFDGLIVNGEHLSLVDDEGRVLDMFLAARFAGVVDGTLRVAFLQTLPPEGGASRSGIFVAVQR